MLRIEHLILSCLCVAGPRLGAQAQVLRCTDAGTGRVTYTDGRCAGAAKAQEVLPRKTAEDIEREREQLAEALARKQQRLEADAIAAQTEALREAQRERTQAAPRPQDPARSAECARSRRRLDALLSGSDAALYEQSLRIDAAQKQVDLDCLGPAAYAELEKARSARSVATPPLFIAPPYRPIRPTPAPAPAPRKFTQCNVFRCYDSQGNSYPH